MQNVEMQTFSTREEWLQNRKNGIGGSEISAVIGANPYLSNVDLWRLKTGRKEPSDISDKACVKYGQQAEMHLRGLFRLDYPQYSVDYVDNNSFTNSRYEWALASLDGWLTDQDGRSGILEIKTTEILNPAQWDKWGGKYPKPGEMQIPQNYYCQCLFYMAVKEADFCVLVAQIKYIEDGEMKKQTRQYKIERIEVQEDIEYLMLKGSEFWQYVKADKQPPLILPGI